jgi:hypothetical protein
MMATVFSLNELIAAPVVALLDADAHAAQRFADFVTGYGFGGSGELRTFSFHYMRTGADGHSEVVSIAIPAIALIPLPALQIKDAQFRFGVRILDGSRPASPARVDLGAARVGLQAPQPAPPIELRGSFARNASADPQVSTDATIAVTVNVTQSDMPAGLSTLLAALHDAASVEVAR